MSNKQKLLYGEAGDPMDLLNHGGSLLPLTAEAKSSGARGGYNNPNDLVEIKEPPASIVQLRRELEKPENKDIADYAAQGTTFEDCVGRIALCLSIALDGDYDAVELCAMLVEAMRNRGKPGMTASPHLQAGGLVDAEIVEKVDGELTLEKANKLDGGLT
jgi:hypothetical protein